MATMPLADIRQIASELTLANAAELGTSIIRSIAGNDISNRINGSPLTNEVVQTLILQRMMTTAQSGV